MKDEDEDQEPEHTRFYRLAHDWSFDGEDHVISVAAYRLHINGTADATVRGHPGFVPDEYLNSLATSTTLPVADLVIAGFWERVDGGYRIRDWDAVRVTMEHVQMLREREARRHQARTRSEQEQVLKRLRAGRPDRRLDGPPGSPEAAPPG